MLLYICHTDRKQRCSENLQEKKKPCGDKAEPLSVSVLRPGRVHLPPVKGDPSAHTKPNASAVTYLYCHFSHEDGGEDVVGQRQEDALLWREPDKEGK